MQLLGESLMEGPQDLEQICLEPILTALSSHVQRNTGCYPQETQGLLNEVYMLRSLK